MGPVEFALALGVTVRGLDDCACVCLAVARPQARRDRSRSHGSRYRSRDRRDLGKGVGGLGSRRDRVEAVVASRDCGNSGSRVEFVPAVAGSSIPWLTPSLPDLARLFLNLSGPLALRVAAVGSLFSAAGVTGAGVLPGPAAPVTSMSLIACSSASVPAPDVVTPAGAASATGSSCRHERARESPRSGGVGQCPAPSAHWPVVF